MAKIESFDGKTREIDCIGCAIARGELDVSRARVIKTPHFSVHQDYEIPIPGFLILGAQRHILSVMEFSEEEREEFLDLLILLRKGMKDVLNVKEVYFFQNEDSPHHFHLWMFPRYSWMERFGRKIESVRPIMHYAREHLKTEKNLKQVDDAVQRMRKYMKGFKC